MSSVRTDVGYFGADSITKLLGVSEEFHFSNGTVDYVNMGNYSHRTVPADWAATSVWTSTGVNSFTFSTPDSNILTDPIVTSFGAIPMHIYERVPAKTWRSSFVSGFTGPTGGLSSNRVTVTWETTKYGGNGSYAWVYGPVSDGPYMYRGYDPASQTATLVKWSGYWNASGLQSMGEFGATQIHIRSIPTENAAIMAFESNHVNYLDWEYSFGSQNITKLEGLGATVVKSLDPGTGWQEMPLNDNAPIWGTGTGTPLGQSNPAKAAFGARMVRKALSYLIPRQQIIDGLFSGRAAPGITQFYPMTGVIHPGDIYNGIKADPYDPAAAREFLAAAGYGAIGAPPPRIVPSQTVAFPSIFLGQSFTLAGIYDPVSVGRELKYGGFAVVLEQSADNGSTWQPVADAYTNVGGYYTLTYTPTLSGTVGYRLFFTGVPVSYLNAQGYGSPASIEAITPPTSNVKSQWQNVTATSYGPVSTVTIGIFGDSFKPLGSKAQLQAVADQITASLGNLSSSISKTLSTVDTEQATASAQVSRMMSSLNIASTTVSGFQGRSTRPEAMLMRRSQQQWDLSFLLSGFH